VKQLGIFLLPLDGMLVHRGVAPGIGFAGAHLCAWVEGGTVGEKCLAWEHGKVFRAREVFQGLIRTARSGGERTGHEALCFHLNIAP